MNNKLRNTYTMLLAGTIAGFLSGLIFPLVLGLRGSAFGFALSLTVWLVRKRGWTPVTFLPGLLIGILFFFRPPALLEELAGEPNKVDPVSLLNAFIFIPTFTAAYRTSTWKKRIWMMLLVGLLSSTLRGFSFDSTPQALLLVVYNFPIGMLPFLLLWLLAMRLTDPALSRPEEIDEP